MRKYGTYDWIAPPPAVRLVVKNQFREQVKTRRQAVPWSFRLESFFTPKRTLALTGAVAFSAILVMGFVLFSLLTESPTLNATMTHIAGSVEVQVAGNPRWQQLEGGTELKAGDRIRSGIAAEATIQFPDDSIAILGENAQLAILQLTAPNRHGGQFVVLHQYLGQTEYDIQPQDPETSWFEVATSSANVTVVGTKFTVEVTEYQSTLVSVQEGIVEISGQESAIVLEAGQIASVLPQSKPVYGILNGAPAQPCRPTQDNERNNSCFTSDDESDAELSSDGALLQLIVPEATPSPTGSPSGEPTTVLTSTISAEPTHAAANPLETRTPQPSATSSTPPTYDATATRLPWLTVTPPSPPTFSPATSTVPPPANPPLQPTSTPAQPTSQPPSQTPPPPTVPPPSATPPPPSATPLPPPSSTPLPPTPTLLPPTSTSVPPTTTPPPPTPTPPPYP